MTVVDSCMLQRWNLCIGCGRTACTFLHLCAWIWCCYLGSFQCEVIISLPFPATNHTADGRRLFISSEPMEWRRRSDCTCMLMCAWLWSRHWSSIQDGINILPSFPVEMYCNGDAWSAFTLVASMDRPRCTWTNRKYVCIPLFAFEGVIGGSMQREVIISSSLPVKICSITMVGIRLSWSHRLTISLALDYQYVRLHSCALDFKVVVWGCCIVRP